MTTGALSMKTIFRAAAVAALLVPALASAEGINVSGRASTLGLGAEIGYAFNDYLNVRLALNNYSYDYDTTEDDISYNFDLELDSTAVLVDYHPFAGSFRITGGFLDNRNELNGQAETAGTYDIGGTTYTSAEVGTLYSNVKLGDSNPLYLGFGWSKALADSGFGFGFDLGVVMMGGATVKLTPQGGSLMADPNFQANIAEEEQNAQDDLNDFETFPVIALGVTYQF